MVPCFGFLGTFPVGFEAKLAALFALQGGGGYVMYIPWYSPLLVHIANLMMVSIVEWRFNWATTYWHTPQALTWNHTLVVWIVSCISLLLSKSN